MKAKNTLPSGGSQNPGQLDDEALFYLRSRGIPKNEARALLLHAFASETYSNVENQAVKMFIEELISYRLAVN